jgi:hypothetical protein
MLVAVVILGAAWVLLVGLPFARFGLSLVMDSGSTPFERLLPADPVFRLSASLEGHVVSAGGETTLPDGSRIAMSAEYSGNEDGDFYANSDAIVSAGTFRADFDVSGWPTGRVYVDARFDIGDHQTPAVVARYGADGSAMNGPRVFDDERTMTSMLHDFQAVYLP